jgi:hypothetical protein
VTSIIPPDPADDLIGYLRWLGAMVESIKEGYKARRVSASEAARVMGYSKSYFRSKPWRVPGYGAKGTMHSITDWESWLARPEAERRAEWDAMDVRSRRWMTGPGQ